MRPLTSEGTSQVVESIAGGLHQRQPQPIESASVADNLTVDPQTGGWSTRVGFEAYHPKMTFGLAPYAAASALKIDSLFIWNESTPVGRHHILFESNGNLYFQYEFAGTVLITLQSNRALSTPTSVRTNYTEVNGGLLVTNGYDQPVLLRLWPYGVLNTASVRPYGIPKPPPVIASSVDPTQQQDPNEESAAEAESAWINANYQSIPKFTRDVAGLGNAKNVNNVQQLSRYAWQVSFVTDDGSEGPLSDIATGKWFTRGNARYRYACKLTIPRGPVGTASRRIYRSLNYGPGEADSSQRYFVAEITNNTETVWWDSTPEASLGQLAPASFERAPFPALRGRFAQVFSNRLWIDGGLTDSRTLFYSSAGQHEEFSRSGYVRLSGEGGGVTALRSHYKSLLVFRERGVDALSLDTNGSWVVRPINTEIQVVAHNAIDSVPGLGLMAVAKDGIYLIRGGFEGGSVFEIQWMTANLVDEWSRVTQECLMKAVARYSHATREFHAYLPVDGDDRPSLGLVFHVDKQAWTTRTGFPVGCIDVMPSGALVFGNNGQANNEGLHIISARRAMGRELSGGQQPVWQDKAPPTSTWKSPWLSMDTPQNKKQVQFVTLWVQTTGSVPVTLRVYKDFSRDVSIETSYLAQPADAQLLPVLDQVLLDDGKEWSRTHAVPLRVSVANQSCSWFAFELETTDDLVLVGWSVEYAQRATRVVAGNRA